MHKPGCADLKKNARGASVWTIDVDSLKDIVLDIYPPSDFEYDEANWESQSGDITLMACCPKIHTYDEPTPVPAPVSKRSRIDHSNHDHPATPAARAACRALGAAVERGLLATNKEAKPRVVVVRPGEVVDKNGNPDRSFDRAEQRRLSDIHATRRRAVRVAAVPARGTTGTTPAPKVRQRRSGTPSRCIQAGLHAGRGKCACGWMSPDFKSYV